jgi:hypothetical protein
MTSNFLAIKPLRLTTERDSYTDVEPGGTQDFSSGSRQATLATCLMRLSAVPAGTWWMQNYLDGRHTHLSTTHPGVRLRLKASKPPAASTNLTLMPIRHQAKASPSALRLKRRRRRERRSKPSYTTMGTTFRSQVDGIPLVGQTLTLAWPEPGLALAWPWPGPDPSPGLAWPWPDLA